LHVQYHRTAVRLLDTPFANQPYPPARSPSSVQQFNHFLVVFLYRLCNWIYSNSISYYVKRTFCAKRENYKSFFISTALMGTILFRPQTFSVKHSTLLYWINWKKYLFKKKIYTSYYFLFITQYKLHQIYSTFGTIEIFNTNRVWCVKLGTNTNRRLILFKI
jgi:hypothetical protein